MDASEPAWPAPTITTFDMEHLLIVKGNIRTIYLLRNFKLNRIDYVNRDRSKAARQYTA